MESHVSVVAAPCMLTRTRATNRQRDRHALYDAVQGSVQRTFLGLCNLQHQDGFIYGIGTGTGGILVSKSKAGEDWTQPAVVINGSYSGGSTPVLVADGFVFRALEATVKLPWPLGFHAALAFAAVDSDLTDPSSWRVTAGHVQQ